MKDFAELLSVVGRPDVFSYGEIKSATNNFSQDNILGRGGGGYGLVYKVSSILYLKIPFSLLTD